MWTTSGGRLSGLYAAIAAGSTIRVRILLALEPELANAANETPPPLHWAVFHNRPQIVELLLRSGADIELRDRDRNATPLEYAIVYARVKIIRLLISRGAEKAGSQDIAIRGASGEFEDFPDLPSRRDYEPIVALLKCL